MLFIVLFAKLSFSYECGKREPVLAHQQVSDKIDSFYEVLRSSHVDTILVYKQLNYNTGVKGIVIWKKAGLLKGYIMWLSNSPNDKFANSTKKIEDAIKIYFDDAKSVEDLPPSDIELTHDVEIDMQSYLNGTEKKYRFNASQTLNRKERLAQVANLCYEIIFDY